jgi:hypothetical protein
VKSKQLPIPIPSRCTVEAIGDGGLYRWPAGGSEIPSISDEPYSTVKCLDHVVCKLPTFHGLEEYNKYVVREQTDGDAIRRNEDIERTENFDGLLAKYPRFREATIAFGAEKVHWLLLQVLQYDRLSAVIKIPETRYCFFSRRGFILTSIYPGLIQERVRGISLWDMIDHQLVHQDPERHCFVKQEYEPLVPYVRSQLNRLAAPSFSCHVNWHIKNFVFDQRTNVLYYFDLKPSSIFGRWRNERNLKSLRRDFLR